VHLERSGSGMFARRVVMLAALVLLGFVVALVQMGRLTLAHGEELRTQAESKLVRRTWEPTLRGQILDRKGRVLAQDRPAFDISIDYQVISGRWVEARAARDARAENPERWYELDPVSRERLVEKYAEVYRDHQSRARARLAAELGLTPEDLLDRERRIRNRVQGVHRHVLWTRSQRALDRALARGQVISTELERDISRRVDQPVREQVNPHVIAAGVGDEVGFRLQRLVDATELIPLPGPEGGYAEVPAIPGLTVTGAGTREYPFATVAVEVDRSTLPLPIRSEGAERITIEGLATHLVGWMGSPPQAGDMERRREALASDAELAARALTPSGTDRGRYRDTDQVGRSGVEWAAEHTLRGLRGLRIRHLDTGAEERLEPVPGADVRLTIDAMLQARVQAALTPELGLAAIQPWHSSLGEEGLTGPVGMPLNGAAVVLDVDTGDLLAAVSMPTFTFQDLEERPEWVFENPIDSPWVNRAVAKPYQPGSIVKPLALCHAAARGNYALGDRIECTGHLLPNRPDILRCWIYRDHYDLATHSSVLGHDLDGIEAVTVSCNIFFYTMGQRMGVSGITKLYRKLRVGTPFDVSVGAVFEGTLGPGGDASRLSVFDATLMGMGQGPVAWTPLHAACAYAALARGGMWIAPRVIDDGRAPEVRPLGYSDGAVRDALTGLWRVVNDERYGTAHALRFPEGRDRIFNAPGVDIWGKTGTAQTSPTVHDPDGDGPLEPEIVRDGDHAWFVCLAGPAGGRPRYAIAVIVEHAGSGGRVSGPIANQIVHALVAEGYLPS